MLTPSASDPDDVFARGSSRRPSTRRARARARVSRGVVVVRCRLFSRSSASRPPRGIRRASISPWPGVSFAFVLAHLLASSAFAARPPEIDLAPGDASVLRATFTEGDPPLALTTGALTAGVSGGAPLVRAVVRVANPLDAPLERLGVTASYAEWYLVHGADAPEGPDDVDVDVDATASGPGVTLETVAATRDASVGVASSRPRRLGPRRGRSSPSTPRSVAAKRSSTPCTAPPPTPYATPCETSRTRTPVADPTIPFAASLSRCTTRTASRRRPPPCWSTSSPSTTTPILDLNGAHRPGVDYAAVMGENERRVGVMLADADAHVGDDDGDFLRGARVYREGADPFPRRRGSVAMASMARAWPARGIHPRVRSCSSSAIPSRRTVGCWRRRGTSTRARCERRPTESSGLRVGLHGRRAIRVRGDGRGRAPSPSNRR